MYYIMPVVLGEINSYFGVIYSVLVLIYALTFVERKVSLLLFRCSIDFMLTSGTYLNTYYAVKLNCVGNLPFF